MRSTPPVHGPRPRCRWPCSPDGWSSAPSSPAACSAGHPVDEAGTAEAVDVRAEDDGRYGSMVAVGTVVNWWAGRSDPQRIALYTRSSYYGVLALTPFSALLVVGSSPGRPPVAAVLFLLGSVAVTVAALFLARAGLTRSRRDDRLPRRLLVGAATAAL